MKISKYNLYAPIAKGVVCFNTITQSFAVISNQAYKMLETDDISSLPSNVFDELVECGFIINKNTDEYQLLVDEHNAPELDQIYYLTIMPSLDCNVRCWYCFEKHKKGSRLELKTQEAIFSLVKDILKDDNIKQISIELFGGEPLLYFDEDVYPLLSKIREYTLSQDRSYYLFIVTNGLCITEDMINKFKLLKANFQISIDGYKDIYNKIKKLYGSKEETYDKIIKIISGLTNNDLNVNLRINFDDNSIDKIDGIIQDLANANKKRIKVHLERVWQTRAEGNSNKSVKDVANSFLENGYKLSYMNFFRKSFSCKASRPNEAVISYNGDIFKCSGRDFTEQLQEGSLLDNGKITWQEEKLKKRLSITTYDNEMCKECKYLPLCWGPCNQKQLESKSDNLGNYCQLKYMEMGEEDYILLRFNSALIKMKENV